MELDGGGQEGGGDALVESECQRDQLRAALLQSRCEALSAQVLVQDTAVDGVQGLHSGERQRKHREVPLRYTIQQLHIKPLLQL